MARMHSAHLPKQDTTFFQLESLAGTNNYFVRYFAGRDLRGTKSLAPSDVETVAHAAAQAAADITGVICQWSTAERAWSSVLPRHGA